ncbi:MAG: S1C family serine protease [Pirellulaceae bacterium]
MNRRLPILSTSPLQALLVALLFLLVSLQTVPLLAQHGGDSELERDRMYAQLAEEADLIERHYGLLRKVVSVVQPSVVHIQANKTSRGSNNSLTKVEEAGAGVIMKYAERFFVITNRHVIMDADNRNIRIQLSDGRFFNPTEVRTDPDSDLAVMFLAEKDLAAARFGDSSDVQIGDFVVAVGSPFGLSHSVSYGIISARGRRDLDLGDEGVRFQDFLQTDAAINPGNSGGPLLNLRGEVIGINTAIASNSGGNDGIGFSIPMNMAKKVVNDLLRYGRVRRGFVGVTLDARFSPEKARAIGLSTAFGARISAIAPNSPASQSELRKGDVILNFNGTAIVNDSHLVSEVSQTDIGREVPVVIFRNGSQRVVDVTVEERQAAQAVSRRNRDDE